MRKVIVTVAAACALMIAPAASACSDLSFATGMLKTGKQAESAMTTAGNGNFTAGLTQLYRAQRYFNNTPEPCSSKYRRLKFQFGTSLDFYERGLELALAGSYGQAMSNIKSGNYWLKKANNSLG